MKASSSLRRVAFSLIELLVVVAIIGILAAITVPALASIQRANGVNRAGQMLGDAIIAARQEASSKNRDVELRIILLENPSGYRAFQTWIADDRGVMSPLGKAERLPDSVLIASGSQLSPILEANTNLAGTTNFGALGNRAFTGLRIRAGGLPDPNITTSNNFLTVRGLTDTATPPANFYAIRLVPATGRVTIHRP